MMGVEPTVRRMEISQITAAFLLDPLVFEDLRCLS